MTERRTIKREPSMPDEMIDRERAYALFYERHPPVPWEALHTIAGRMASLRRAIWQILVDTADEAMQVALSPTQIADSLAATSARRSANRGNIQHALRWLREAGLLKVIDHGNGDRCNTYQLCLRPRKVSTVPRRPAADYRLRAFDERAANWTPEKRRIWRAIWRAILVSAGSDGRFPGDIAHLADAASDKLGADISDETVAKLLRWSVATQLTIQVSAGRAPIYRISVEQAPQPGN